MVRPIIHTDKRYNQFTPQTVLVTSTSAFDIVHAVALQDANTAKEIVEGSVVKAVYIEIWLTAEITETTGSFQVTLEKVPNWSANATHTQLGLLSTYDNKKNVLYVTRGLAPISTTNPIPVVRQWFKIPKGKQRMGLGDKIIVHVSAITNPLTWCGFFLFKVQT